MSPMAIRIKDGGIEFQITFSHFQKKSIWDYGTPCIFSSKYLFWIMHPTIVRYVIQKRLTLYHTVEDLFHCMNEFHPFPFESIHIKLLPEKAHQLCLQFQERSLWAFSCIWKNIESFAIKQKQNMKM